MTQAFIKQVGTVVVYYPYILSHQVRSEPNMTIPNPHAVRVTV